MPDEVSLREYFTALLAALETRVLVQFSEMDLRYQQRYDAQIKALDAALLAAEKAVTTALIAAEKAVTKAEVATENRLTLLNELRSGVATMEQMEAMGVRLAELKERLDRIEGRSSGLNAGWVYLVGVIGLIGVVIAIVVRFA